MYYTRMLNRPPTPPVILDDCPQPKDYVKRQAYPLPPPILRALQAAGNRVFVSGTKKTVLCLERCPCCGAEDGMFTILRGSLSLVCVGCACEGDQKTKTGLSLRLWATAIGIGFRKEHLHRGADDIAAVEEQTNTLFSYGGVIGSPADVVAVLRDKGLTDHVKWLPRCSTTWMDHDHEGAKQRIHTHKRRIQCRKPGCVVCIWTQAYMVETKRMQETARDLLAADRGHKWIRTFEVWIPLHKLSAGYDIPEGLWTDKHGPGLKPAAGAARRRFSTTRRNRKALGGGRMFIRQEADGQHLKLSGYDIGGAEEIAGILNQMVADGATTWKWGPKIKVSAAVPPPDTSPVSFEPTLKFASWFTRQVGGVDPASHPQIVADFIEHTTDLHLVESYGACKRVADPPPTDESDDSDMTEEPPDTRAAERIKQQAKQCYICKAVLAPMDVTGDWPLAQEDGYQHGYLWIGGIWRAKRDAINQWERLKGDAPERSAPP